jgi:predicted Zn-dependent peptidase
MDDDVPDDIAHREFVARLFAGHELGRDPAGDREHVRSITPDAVREFFDTHYRAEAMVVSCAGPVGHDEMLAAIDTAFSGVRSGGARPQRSAPDGVSASAAIDADSEQVHLVMGGRGVPRRDPRREALDVVNHVLGGGLSSRLFEEIREQRGLAYSVYSGVSSYEDAGTFQMYAGTQPEHADEVERLMREVLGAVRRDGVTDDELDIAKGFLTGSFELGLEDTGARMSRHGGLLVTTGEVLPVEEQVGRWAAVDQAAVRAVIDEVLPTDPLVVRLGPAG